MDRVKETFSLQCKNSYLVREGDKSVIQPPGMSSNISRGEIRIHTSQELSTLRVASQTSFYPGADVLAQNTPIAQKHKNIHRDLFSHKSRDDKNSFLPSTIGS